MNEQRDKKTQNHICVGLLAHVDAGKTTLSEAILYTSGSIRRLGRVDNKDAFLDTYSLEKERGITIFSKQAEITLDGQPFTLLDTPGHVDFSAEMERTLQVLDYAILVISGADGVQGHTMTLWRLLKHYQVPVFIFVNKMDQEGTDRQALMADIRERLSDNCVDFGEPESARMENLAMCHERMLEEYLENGRIDRGCIVEMIARRHVFPCYFGSALKLTGVAAFLEGLAAYTRPGEYGDTFGARVFKIARDSQGGRLTHMKITGGSLKVRATLKDEKVHQIRIYNGAKFETVEEAKAGTVCAVTGLTATRAGEGLGAEAEQNLPVLEPVLTCRVELPEGSDVHKTLLQLKQLEEEDPELHIVWEDLSGEIMVQLMGEIQTEVLQQLIRERFGLEVGFGPGRIVYKETIAAPVEGVGHFEPLRHYAEVHLRLEPDEPGSGLSFASECSENQLDRNWQRLILTHLEEKAHRGVLLGAPITDMRITLIAGRSHLKHTEGGDFRQATYRAVRQGLKKAESVLLEPYYNFRLELPQKAVGRAMTDLEKMSARFELTTGNDGEAVLTGTAPVAAMGNYQKEVAAYTGGTGRLFCSMAGYFPCHNTEEVLAASDYDSERDLDNPTGSVFCAHGAGFTVPWYEVENYMHLAGAGLEIAGAPFQGNADPAAEMAGRGVAGGEKAAGMAGRGAADGEKAAGMAGRKAAGRETADSSGRGREGVSRPSLVDDKELEAIFVRTYGEIKRRKPQPERLIRAAAEGKGKETPGEKDREKDRKADREKYREKNRETDRETENRRRNRKSEKESQAHYLLVDGYNIIFAWEDLHALSEHSMEAARSKLMDMLSNYQGYRQMHIILVFDAYRVEGSQGEVTRWQNLDVVFTKEAETADQYIEKTAHDMGRKYKVTVATSDGLEQVIIRSQGCLLMTARELREELERASEEIRREHLNKIKDRGNYLLNYLPQEEAERMEAIRQGRQPDGQDNETG